MLTTFDYFMFFLIFINCEGNVKVYKKYFLYGVTVNHAQFDFLYLLDRILVLQIASRIFVFTGFVL